MSDLLSFAVSAHGGLDRWNTFQAIEARMAVGGGIFRLPLLVGPAKAYELLYTGELDVRGSRLLDHLVGACEQHRRQTTMGGMYD